MDARQTVVRLGGVTDRATLVRLLGRAAVDAALRRGELVRDARGRYALPVADSAIRAANALDGVVALRSAALLHGWELKSAPVLPDVLVPRGRKVSAERRQDVTLHRGAFEADERLRRVTSPGRTLVDCLRLLRFDEALAVADSALRHGAFSPEELVRLATSVRGTGAPQARRVAALADGRAANPFESALRALALDVPGLSVQPQLEIRAHNFSVRPDLVDDRLRLVLEADSFAWHGDRGALRWDAQRYNNLVVRGWTVLRFAWEDVMHDPAYVRRTLVAAVRLAERRTPCSSGGCPDA